MLDIPISRIRTVHNIRRIEETDPGVAELAASMQENGQQIEIRVWQNDDTYFLKAGHRRLAAAQSLGWKSIRAIVDPTPANQADFLLNQYLENSHRLGMRYMERAAFYLSLRDAGLSQREIAVKCGVSDTDVSLALSALNADPRLQKALDDERISHSAIEPLLSLPLEDQAELADAALRERTVRKINSLVSAYKLNRGATQQAAQNTDIDDDVDPLEFLAVDEIEEALRKLRSAAGTGITHPELVSRARPKVKELIALAKSILRE